MHKPPKHKPPTPPKPPRHKKPGPDSPYEIARETRRLVREIHCAVVHGQPGGLTPQEIEAFQQIGLRIQAVTTALTKADRDT